MIFIEMNKRMTYTKLTVKPKDETHVDKITEKC